MWAGADHSWKYHWYFIRTNFQILGLKKTFGLFSRSTTYIFCHYVDRAKTPLYLCVLPTQETLDHRSGSACSIRLQIYVGVHPLLDFLIERRNLNFFPVIKSCAYLKNDRNAHIFFYPSICTRWMFIFWPSWWLSVCLVPSVLL